MKTLQMLIAGFLFVMHAGAQEAKPVPESIPAGKGAVDASGKFVPNNPETGKGTPETREQAEAKLRESLQVTQEGANRFRIGKVTFDRVSRVVTIPATVNMDSGLVEYALVTETGKVHEAVFATKASPTEIHLACLLLGISVPKADAKGNDGKPDSPACQIRVTVTWDTNGPPAEHELAAMVVTSSNPNDPAAVNPMPAGAWHYTGSVMGPGGFAAAAEGSVISLISDSSALVENPRDDSKRDDQHLANHKLLPRKGSPVRILLTLPSPPPSKP